MKSNGAIDLVAFIIIFKESLLSLLSSNQLILPKFSNLFFKLGIIWRNIKLALIKSAIARVIVINSHQHVKETRIVRWSLT